MCQQKIYLSLFLRLKSPVCSIKRAALIDISVTVIIVLGLRKRQRR